MKISELMKQEQLLLEKLNKKLEKSVLFEVNIKTDSDLDSIKNIIKDLKRLEYKIKEEYHKLREYIENDEDKEKMKKESEEFVEKRFIEYLTVLFRKNLKEQKTSLTYLSNDKDEEERKTNIKFLFKG